MKILITGGCGFVGHHFVEHLLKNTDWDIKIMDRLSYSSNGFDRLRDIEAYDDSRVTLFTHDFTLPVVDGIADEIGDVDYIVHMGAESHVDNSIEDPMKFVRANVVGTANMLEYLKTLDDVKFIYFSTDEVYGPANDVDFKEGDRHNPGNPYAATKAAAEDLCRSYANTYDLNVMITNTMNVIGQRQHPEKFVPKIINYTLEGKTLSIHANSDRTKAGSRFYIHARNVADALLKLLNDCEEYLDIEDPQQGQFNIVGEREMDNLELAEMVAGFVGKELQYEMVDFHSSRPGHDLRYALDGSKMESMGWTPPTNFEQSLKETVEWSLNNDKWL